MDWFKGEKSLIDALSRLKASLKEMGTTVDLDDLCKNVKGIEPTSEFVTFLDLS